jgi:hypothetical protein
MMSRAIKRLVNTGKDEEFMISNETSSVTAHDQAPRDVVSDPGVQAEDGGISDSPCIFTLASMSRTTRRNRLEPGLS